MGKKRAVQAAPAAVRKPVATPMVAVGGAKPAATDLAPVKQWLAGKSAPTVVFLEPVKAPLQEWPAYVIRGVRFGTFGAACAGIRVAVRSNGKSMEFCAIAGGGQVATVTQPIPKSESDGNSSTPSALAWSTQYLTDCPLLFVVTEPRPIDNALVVTDPQQLASLLCGGTTEVAKPAAVAAPEPKKVVAAAATPEPKKAAPVAASTPAKKAVAAAPVKKAAPPPPPAEELEPEFEDDDVVPEDEADEPDAETEDLDDADDDGGGTYTREELEELDAEQLFVLLTNAGVQVSATMKRDKLLALALSQLDE